MNKMLSQTDISGQNNKHDHESCTVWISMCIRRNAISCPHIAISYIWVVNITGKFLADLRIPLYFDVLLTL